jgi:prepilin-type N-terminal cleavage/methylation domain-containing protein
MTIFGKSNTRAQRGFTLIEVLIAVLITAIVAVAAFRFYVTMHSQVITQQEISEMQQLCRASLTEMCTTLKKAGYKMSDNPHPKWQINGDSLYVFYSETQPVDTVLYYLEEFTTFEYTKSDSLPAGVKLYKLMKKENSGVPAIFSDFITGCRFTSIDDANLQITVQTQTSKKDEAFNQNGGFRRFSNTERVTIRNANT